MKLKNNREEGLGLAWGEWGKGVPIESDLPMFHYPETAHLWKMKRSKEEVKWNRMTVIQAFSQPKGREAWLITLEDHTPQFYHCISTYIRCSRGGRGKAKEGRGESIFTCINSSEAFPRAESATRAAPPRPQVWAGQLGLMRFMQEGTSQSASRPDFKLKWCDSKPPCLFSPKSDTV